MLGVRAGVHSPITLARGTAIALFMWMCIPFSFLVCVNRPNAPEVLYDCNIGLPVRQEFVEKERPMLLS